MKRWLFFLMTFTTLLFGSTPKHQILYSIQKGEIEKGIELLTEEAKREKKYDFALLAEIGHLLLTQGVKGGDEETLLLTLYGLGIAGSTEGIELYEMGLKSENPLIQIATLQLLNQIHEDEFERVLFAAFSSPYLLVRMEAAYLLASRRSLKASGMIESLMIKLPPEFHLYFPELFAMIGTPDAIGVLKQLTSHPNLRVRQSALHAAARFGRDDFLEEIRSFASHSNPAEQETSAAALGLLKDSSSIPLLKELARSKHPSVKLAACHSLAELGEHSYRSEIMKMAQDKNPFAIPLLVDIPESDSLLESLLTDPQFSLQFNAALALLKKGNPKSIPTLMKFLIRDERDLGVMIQSSCGNALRAWKIIPSCSHYSEKMKQDHSGETLALKERILEEASQLPEREFINVARELFSKHETPLIPKVVHLLEELGTQEVLELLERESNRLGAPLIRSYCQLALFRVRGDPHYRELTYRFLKHEKDHQIFRFRGLKEAPNQSESFKPFTLTPEENSRLMIEGYEALVKNHDLEGLELLLSAIANGEKKNRSLLAALLIKAIQ